MNTGMSHVPGHIFLKIGKIPAFRGNRPAAHAFETGGGTQDGFPAGRFVRLPHQGVVVHALGNLVLHRVGKGAGIAHVLRENPGRRRPAP